MTYTLSLNTNDIPTHTLNNYSTTGYAFIDQDFTNHHKVPLYPLKIPCALDGING
jgi:hypothetical protein